MAKRVNKQAGNGENSAIIHCLNWKALGKEKEANQAKNLAIAFGVVPFLFLFVDIFIFAFPPFFYLAYWVFAWAAWYGFGNNGDYATGKKQIEYVEKTYGNDYKRNSLVVPVIIAVIAYIVFSVFSSFLYV